MKPNVFSALIAALVAPGGLHATTAGPARLILTVETGAETGSVMVSLFDSGAAYGGSAPVRRARIDVAKGERTVVIAGLKPGTYAVKAYHDVDGNGRMTTNPFGLPIEPFAFSNKARGNMGAAAWDHARFTVAGETRETIDFVDKGTSR
jgi:uncharacterized protein (DUF2141 family)